MFACMEYSAGPVQAKGKAHISHISKMANRIWADENNYTLDWTICLTEAFRRHRIRLISSERHSKPMKFNTPKKAGSGIWVPNGPGCWIEKPLVQGLDS